MCINGMASRPQHLPWLMLALVGLNLYFLEVTHTPCNKHQRVGCPISTPEGHIFIPEMGGKKRKGGKDRERKVKATTSAIL